MNFKLVNYYLFRDGKNMLMRFILNKFAKVLLYRLQKIFFFVLNLLSKKMCGQIYIYFLEIEF